MNRKRISLPERFWEKVDKSAGPDGCWLWTAGKNQTGYGQFAIGAAHRSLKAHRVAWGLENGPVLNHIHVLHHCHNPPCCNPKHLYIGSHQDNMRDMKLSGRRKNKVCGENHPCAKLTADQVKEIRATYRTGYGVAKQFCRKYGIHRATLYALVSGHTWNG